MDEEYKFSSIITLYNSLNRYLEYIMHQCTNNEAKIYDHRLELEDLSKVIFSFIQLDILFNKENIIKNDGNLIYKSKIYEEKLNESIKLMFKEVKDGQFLIGNEIADAATIYSIIKNKLAHGDYYYDCEDISIMFHKKTGDFKIKIIDFIKFYDYLIEDIYHLYKENNYERTFIINKLLKDINEELKNDREIIDFLKTLIILKYSLKRCDNKQISLEEKINFEKYIDFINGNIKTDNFKVIKNAIINEYYEKGYNLSIKESKIKNKEIIDKIISTLKKVEFDGVKNNKFMIDNYCTIINKILDKNYDKNGIRNGIYYNINTLKNMIVQDQTTIEELLLEKKENIYLKYNANKALQEMILTIELAKFVILYCYPLDNIYKKGNCYCLDRKEQLNFSCLNLEKLKPEIIDTGEYEIISLNKRCDSLIKEINKLKTIYEKQYQNIENLINNSKEPHKIEELVFAITKLKETIIEKENLLIELNEYRLKVKNDFELNNKHFYNLKIIEGIRNAISHGNIRVTNFEEVELIEDLNIEFVDNYKGKIHFKMNVTINDLTTLFDEENINEIQLHVNKILNKKKRVI